MKVWIVYFPELKKVCSVHTEPFEAREKLKMKMVCDDYYEIRIGELTIGEKL